ncbi:MAG: hypothetical protein ACFFB3_13360 [Candidatus Hodarchaeota archaeon]
MKHSQQVKEHQLAELVKHVIGNTPFYQKKYQGIPLNSVTIAAFEALPYSSIDEFHHRANPEDLCSDQQESYYIFIGEDSFTLNGASYWNLKFLDSQTSILANTLKDLGLCSKDRVLNLFIPGISGTWQLFNFALERIGATIIPLGGEAELPVMAHFLADLKTNVLAGSSPTIFSLLEFLVSRDSQFFVETIVLAGESLPRDQLDFMKQYAEKIFSPIYFSLETGIVGTQCSHIPAGTFHFSETVYAEIISPQDSQLTDSSQGELVVTSLLSRASPNIRYRTGDHIELFRKSCICGNPAPLFKLNSIATHDESIKYAAEDE